MENICAWIERIIRYAESHPHLPLKYAGTGSSWGTMPAPCIELTYMFEGECSALKMGPEQFSLPNNHMALLSVHHGNYALNDQRFRSWCAFLDVSDSPEFSCLNDKPLFFAIPVSRPEAILRAFKLLAIQSPHFGRWETRLTCPVTKMPLLNPEQPSRSVEVFAKAAFLNLMGVFLQEVEMHTHPVHMTADTIRSAIDFLTLNYQNPEITLKNIADAVYLNPDHFGRLFKQMTGQSPIQYLRRLRIEQSCFLLHNTTDSIDAISRQVGFEDAYYFSRVFKEVKGICPRNFRRRNPDSPPSDPNGPGARKPSDC